MGRGPSARGVAILNRSLFACLLVALLIAPLASAQLPPTIELSSDRSHADVLPGTSTSFTVSVKNTGALAKTVSLRGVSTNAPDWSYDFQPTPVLTIDAGATNNTTLVVNVPPTAKPGNFTLGFESTEPTAPPVNMTPQADSAVLSFTFTVLAPPPAPEKPAPKLDLEIAASTAPIGLTADGVLTLINSGTSSYRVSLSIAGPFGWHPSLDLTDVTVHPSTTAHVSVHAVVPQDATEGTTQAFTLRALVDDATISKTWTVTATAPPPSATTTPPTTGNGANTGGATTGTNTGGAGSSGSGASTLPDPVFALTATPEPAELDAPGGESITATVRLQNRGTETLHLKLLATAGDRWPVRLGATEFDLAAGAIRDIPMAIDVPAGVPGEGTAQASVYITGDAGLAQTVQYTLHTQLGKPIDNSAKTAVLAPPAPAGGLGITTTQATIVVGLGAVGAGALALARRPLREKMVWAGVGLYTRLLRPDVLGHDERQKLFTLVEKQPGIHFHALQRELNWNTGALTYHLRVLERHGFVVDRRDGPLRRFYISGAAPRKELFNQDQPHGLRADVLEAIRNQHGISQSDLALALGANKQTVNYHVKALERAGVIRVEKRGRETFLYVTQPGAPGTAQGPAQA